MSCALAGLHWLEPGRSGFRGSLRCWFGRVCHCIGCIAAAIAVLAGPAFAQSARHRQCRHPGRGRLRLQRRARKSRHLQCRQRAGFLAGRRRQPPHRRPLFRPAVQPFGHDHRFRRASRSACRRRAIRSRRRAGSSTRRCAGPTTRPGASLRRQFRQLGHVRREVDGSLPISRTLALRLRAQRRRAPDFPDGTNNFNHTESLIARWRPAPASRSCPSGRVNNDYDDEAGTFYVPAGNSCRSCRSPIITRAPSGRTIRYTGLNAGLLASARVGRKHGRSPGRLPVGATTQSYSFTNLLADEQPDGSGERLLFADPPTQAASNSGEFRLTHSIPDGPRLHVFHPSVRERDARREFGGSDFLDFGPGRIGEDVTIRSPTSSISANSATIASSRRPLGIAYDGRWKNVGEISFGISRANYRKDTVIPGHSGRGRSLQPAGSTMAPPPRTSPSPSSSMRAMRAGLRKAALRRPTPPTATSRFRAILTEQKDAGVRIRI